jgi:hypothetical protein
MTVLECRELMSLAAVVDHRLIILYSIYRFRFEHFFLFCTVRSGDVCLECTSCFKNLDTIDQVWMLRGFMRVSSSFHRPLRRRSMHLKHDGEIYFSDSWGVFDVHGCTLTYNNFNFTFQRGQVYSAPTTCPCPLNTTQNP